MIPEFVDLETVPVFIWVDEQITFGYLYEYVGLFFRLIINYTSQRKFMFIIDQ